MSIHKMKLKEIQVDLKPSLSEGSASIETGNLDVLTKLAKEQKRNEEIKKQLTLEKARADRLQKKVQFIQDNQDLFNQLKEVYVSMKESNRSLITKAIQNAASQTNTLDSLKKSSGQITAVSKQDLAEVAQLVRELKTVVSKGGKRVFAALESEKSRDGEFRKKIEAENHELKRELFNKTSELERLRMSAGAGPREVSLLRRIVAKLILAGNDFSNLSTRESQLARHIAKKYELKHKEIENKMLDNANDEEVMESSGCLDTSRSTPRTPKTPNSAKDVFSTPRWVRGEDVP